MGRPKHFSRPPITQEEQQALQGQLVDDMMESMGRKKVTTYQVAKGSGLNYQVVKRVLEGHECKWWVVKAIEKYLDAPQEETRKA